MVDPKQMLQRATSQLRNLEAAFMTGQVPGRDSIIDPHVWRDLEEAAETMARSVPAHGQASPAGRPFPPVDLFVTDQMVVVNAAIPGVERAEDLKVEVLGDQRLRISGKLPAHPMAGQVKPAVAEQVHGPFNRVVPIPVAVRPETARSAYQNGLLEIWLERPPEQARSVPILM